MIEHDAVEVRARRKLLRPSQQREPGHHFDGIPWGGVPRHPGDGEHAECDVCRSTLMAPITIVRGDLRSRPERARHHEGLILVIVVIEG